MKTKSVLVKVKGKLLVLLAAVLFLSALTAPVSSQAQEAAVFHKEIQAQEAAVFHKEIQAQEAAVSQKDSQAREPATSQKESKVQGAVVSQKEIQAQGTTAFQKKSQIQRKESSKKESLNQKVEEIYSRMTLEERVGQLIYIQLDALAGGQGNAAVTAQLKN